MRELLKRSAEAPKSFLELVGVEGVLLTKLDVRLVGDPGLNSLRFSLSPRSLLDALWLQLAQKLSAGGVIRQCQHCGGWFEAGPGSGRRFDAKFCSDDHRVVFNSRRRSNSTHVTGHKEGSNK